MRKNNIITLEKAFFFLSEMTYQFFMQDLTMHRRQGIIYKEKQYSHKFVYKLRTSFFQIKAIVENENKKKILEKLQKMEEVLTEKMIESGKYEGPRTFEKDFELISWDIGRQYCYYLIIEMQGVNKKEWLIKNIEDLIVNVYLNIYMSKRKEIKKKVTIIKEKAITQRLKKQKKN